MPIGPFDVICVWVAAVETVPEAWTAQLAEGGRLALVQLDQDGVGRAGFSPGRARCLWCATHSMLSRAEICTFDRKKAFVF
ncbi:MAG: hypothetical protein R3B94_05045 [Hyphomonas sp.]